MKNWHLALILILLLLSLGFTARLSDEKYHSEEIIEPIIEPKEPIEPEPKATPPLLKENETIKTEPLEADEPPETNLIHIEIKDMEFEPREITVPIGTTIVWVNKDWSGFYGRIHMIVSSTGDFRSQRLEYNSTFNVTFTETGTYKYLDPIYRSQASGGILIPPGVIYVE